MPYPWPSFGGFLFKREETVLWGTDVGWRYSPSYSRSRPLGSDSDVIDALSIGSVERTFDVVLSADRLRALYTMLNTKALFTDWGRPVPDSRQAFLSGIEPVEQVIGIRPTGLATRKYKVNITLISA